MTATEAREAAEWHARQAGDPPSDEAYSMHRRAAVALAAFADGLDRPESRATSADTKRLHRIRAQLLDLVPLDGTMSAMDDVQRLDRALADAEARGRAHGLLATAWMLDGTTLSVRWDGRWLGGVSMDPIVRSIAQLAAEVT